LNELDAACSITDCSDQIIGPPEFVLEVFDRFRSVPSLRFHE